MHLSKIHTKQRTFSSILALGLGLAPAVIALSPLEPAWAQSPTSQQQLWQLLQQASQETKQGDSQQSIETLQQALEIARQLQDKRSQAEALLMIGFNFINLGQPLKALEYFNQALPVSHLVGNKLIEARILHNIGAVYVKRKQPQKGLTYYRQALTIWKSIGRQEDAANTLNNIAGIYSNIDQPQKALEYYNQALSFLGLSSSRDLKATILANIGLLYKSTGQPQKALKSYKESLLILQEIGARSDESQSLGNIGEIYRYQGRFQEALDYYNRALLIQQELREPRIKAVMLNNAGAVYETIGKPSKALEYYSEALLIYQSIGFKTNKDRTSLGITLNNIGQVFLTIGLPQKALEQHKQALLILQESGDPVFEATALSNIGLVYDNLGQPQKALEYYKQALLIQQDLKKYRDGEVRIFNNIGSSYRNIGKHWKALEYYNRALSISQTIEYRAGESAALNNIGTVYSDVGQPQKALEFYKQVLSIDLLRKYPFGEARTLSNIGDVYSAISQPQKALDYYNKALLIHRSIKDRFGEVATLSSMAATYSYTEQPIAAIKKWEEAVNVTLQMRSELTRTNRSAFLRTQRRAVTGLVSVLIERSNPDSAYNWANLVTTSELADYARLLDVNVRDAEAQKALDQLNQQNQRLQPLYQRLQEKFSEDLAREIRALEEERTKQIEVNIKKFPDLAELLEITPTDITDLKASIPDGTTVVHPVLLTNIRNIPNEIAFFILTKDRLTVKKVPIDPKQLDALLSQTYAQLTNRFTGYSASLAQLYDLLIRPIEPQIQATNPKQLSIIATGRLRYLPFEALYDQKTEQYLIKKYPVNYLTRLSTRSLGSKNNGSPTAEKRVLAVGNPVPKAPLALPGSETEVQDIVKTIPGSEAMLREQATLAAFKLQALRFPWLHLATHGCFRPQGCCLGTPEECQKSPRIDLQANTILFADQKFNIADAALLGLQNVDLITLSACQTALQTNSNGEEIAGLAYLFERAGAKAVIASLWSAPDKKTQALMMQFYTNLKNGMSKSEALRQAKLSQIDSHPFFWAPFVLIGDPR